MKASLKIPESQSELTLEMFQKWKSLTFTETNDRVERVKLIKIFCNVPEEFINKMKRSDFMRVSNHLFAVLQEDPKFTPQFRMDKKDFGFIPNLDEISVGEYVDLDTYLGDWKTMHLAMAILYREKIAGIKDTYRIVPYNGTKEYGEKMKQMPLSVVRAAMVFFYRLSSQLLTIIPNYLKEELNREKESLTMNQQKRLAQLLGENGVGISTYTHLLGETTSKLRKLLQHNYCQPYNFSRFKKITTMQ